jgi:hypothetical protein
MYFIFNNNLINEDFIINSLDIYYIYQFWINFTSFQNKMLPLENMYNINTIKKNTVNI